MFLSSRLVPCRTQALAAHTLTGLSLLVIIGTSTAAMAATVCVNPGGPDGFQSTLRAAREAANIGDTVQVASGTYAEQVTITKSVSLVAASGATPIIDATGLGNGIFINGMSAAPNTGVTGVLVSGFTGRNAKFEGMRIANGDATT